MNWDIGYANKALTEFVCTKVTNKLARILIPGAGSGYEAEYLWNLGYKNIILLDVAPEAKSRYMDRVPDFPENQFIIGDFFELEEKFDVILEQTFFCALDPKLRPAYSKKMSEILTADGCLAGVLFNFEKEDGPPFGGSKEEYLGYFEPYFKVLKMEGCYNSIEARKGNEYFFELRLKEAE